MTLGSFACLKCLLSPLSRSGAGSHSRLDYVPQDFSSNVPDLSKFPGLLLQGRRWHPTPVLLPRKSHGWRSLVGCSPWGREESDTTERLHFHFHFSLKCIGEGNGNPLQYSCLENPRDRGARWAAVYGVAQSRTRLKRHSSSSRVTVETASAIVMLSEGI